MNFNELENYLSSLPDKILDDAAEIVAETATSYYKERFREKAFDGNPWAPAKVLRQNGSLLIDSGNLLNSIRPAYVGRDKVAISAGNDKVDYAKVHRPGDGARPCASYLQIRECGGKGTHPSGEHPGTSLHGAVGRTGGRDTQTTGRIY